MSLRLEFVRLASQNNVGIAELCRRFNISRQTGYTWLSRVEADGSFDPHDRSRRPHASPWKTSDAVEVAILELRRSQPTWGGRKIAARLKALGFDRIPVASTITRILERHDLLGDTHRVRNVADKRFEYDRPNALWQMDFKGHFALENGRCHPLTVLDDHSRYNMALRACANERGETVQDELTRMFRTYGLPERMLTDNGAPWGGQGRGLSKIETWLMRLDIHVMHGRPYHPQTQGKEERFHRTLKADVLQFNVPKDLPTCQKVFDNFRRSYNFERPHEALDLMPPISRYQPSLRAFPESLPDVEYAPGDEVRKVYSPGQLRFKGRCIIVGGGLTGQPVAIRPTLQEGVYDVIYCSTTIKQIDLRKPDQEL